MPGHSFKEAGHYEARSAKARYLADGPLRLAHGFAQRSVRRELRNF